MRITELFHRKARQAEVQAPRVVLLAESHAGRHGYTVLEDGRRRAWGPTADAALASYRVSKAA
jgi:hypothetical protein